MTKNIVAVFWNTVYRLLTRLVGQPQAEFGCGYTTRLKWSAIRRDTVATDRLDGGSR